MSKSKGSRELILQYLEILKLKMTEEQLDHFLQQHTQTALSVSELLAKFLEGPAGTSQEVSLQSRIRRADMALRCYGVILRFAWKLTTLEPSAIPGDGSPPTS